MILMVSCDRSVPSFLGTVNCRPARNCADVGAMDVRLAVMKNVHLVIPDLFLPQEIAADVCAGLSLPALQKMLAQAQLQPLPPDTLEAWLCETFGVAEQAVAPVTLRADGIAPDAAYWLRADPVHLRLQRDQLVMQPQLPLVSDEAAQLCASLNAHFSDTGLSFFAPDAQRWYLRLDSAPEITTSPIAQVTGRNVHAYLPQGPDALRWHGIFNEIQMLFFEHAVNQAREARGELPINSVWLWGGGRAPEKLLRPFVSVYGDSPLALALAQTTGLPVAALQADAARFVARDEGDVLVVWEGLRDALQQGDLHAWRNELQRFESSCAAPLLAALSAGRISQLTLEIPHGVSSRRLVLTRAALWKLWRRSKPLARLIGG